MKNSGCYQTCERSSKDIACVEDRNTSGDLLAVVKDAEKIHSTRVVGRFGYTKEARVCVSHSCVLEQGPCFLQANQKKTDKVVADGGQPRHDGPQAHTGSHVVAGPCSGEEHVLRNVRLHT